MKTTIGDSPDSPTTPFKIDLIVWKPCSYVHEVWKYSTLFKIDLIVWKPDVYYFNTLEIGMFKIDLIVWKRTRLDDLEEGRQSLK